MFSINSDQLYSGKTRAIIQADTTPEVMPTTGEGVTGLADGEILAPGSILYDVGAGDTYFLGEDGETWTMWGGADEEGGDGE